MPIPSSTWHSIRVCAPKTHYAIKAHWTHGGKVWCILNLINREVICHTDWTEAGGPECHSGHGGGKKRPWWVSNFRCAVTDLWPHRLSHHGSLTNIMWAFKFSRRRVWCSELSSGMYCRVKWLSTIILHGSTSQKTILNNIMCLYTNKIAVY
jgi:hypothetical protein